MPRSRTLVYVPSPGEEPQGLIVDDRHPSDPDYYTTGRKVAAGWPEQDPVPLVCSTDPRPADAPPERKAMQNVAAYARRSGWEVRVGYSLANVRAVKKGTYKLVHTYGLWGKGYGWRWCAMYTWSPDLKKEWAWDGTALWREDQAIVAPGLGTRFVDANITDLRAFLGLNGGVGAAWLKGVHARVMEKRTKERAKTTTSKEGAS